MKVEIDTNPPPGATLETKIIRRFVLLNLLHYDRASLFAGKLHAILSRKYTKGRDLYDLAWYHSDPAWPEPNLDLLQNALQQTGWKGEMPTPENWKRIVQAKLSRVNWQRALQDVAPFLERPRDRNLVSPEFFSQLLRERGGP